MANYANLLATIAANIYTNNINEVTAAMVKTAVDSMVASLGAGYQFIDVATPTTNPGTPDQRVVYVATEAGTYTFFDSCVVPSDSLAFLIFDGEWNVRTLSLPNSGAGEEDKFFGSCQGQTTINIFDKYAATLDKIYSSTGVETSFPGYFHSDFIPINPGANEVFITYISPAISGRCVCWDSGKNCLGLPTFEEQTTLSPYYTKCTLPAGTRFITINGTYSGGLGDIVNRVFYRYYNDSDDAPYGVPVGLSEKADKTYARNGVFTQLCALNGGVSLPSGTFVLVGFALPAGCYIEGMGDKSIIELKSTELTNSAVICSGDNVISDVRFDGGGTTKPSSSTIFGRNGLSIPEATPHNIITNCSFIGWSGAGLYVLKTGYSQLNSAIINNCYFRYNVVGLYLGEKAEYAAVNNSIFIENYHGIKNNGGNNKFSGCGIDGNAVGFSILKDGIDAPNNGHGTCVGCTFNHNTVQGIYISETNNGFAFSGCEIHANGTMDVDIWISGGVVFSGCQFGLAAKFRLAYNAYNMLIGCVFGNDQYSFTLGSNNVPQAAINCYTHVGVPVTIPNP